jgi:hypothetical protein
MKDILTKAPRDAEGNLLAPNGKKSNLTERQYVHVRTKAFKEWFGDWESNPKEASKVVDENGEPLVVYHSGNKGINIFNREFDKKGIGRQFWGNGFYFGGKNSIDKWSDLYKLKTGNTASVYEVFLNIKNPTHKAIKGEVSASEYDGAIFEPMKSSNGDTDWMYIIGNSNQVKSATDNIGTYSTTNDDIRFREIKVVQSEQEAYDLKREYDAIDKPSIRSFVEKAKNRMIRDGESTEGGVATWIIMKLGNGYNNVLKVVQPYLTETGKGSWIPIIISKEDYMRSLGRYSYIENFTQAVTDAEKLSDIDDEELDYHEKALFNWDSLDPESKNRIKEDYASEIKAKVEWDNMSVDTREYTLRCKL